MTSNNEYFKRIYETLSNQTVNTNHNDNYYLKQISLCYGNSYNSNKCNGKYLKDIAEQITGKTYEKIHFRNYYLREIVETVYQGSLTGNSDNYYLRIWSENCDTTTLASNITLASSSLSVDVERTFSLSGRLSVGSGESVDIYENNVLLETVTTGADGSFTLSDLYKSITGSFTYQAKFNGNESYSRCSSDKVTVSIVKRNAVLSMSVVDNDIIYGESVVLNGTLSYDNSSISNASVKIYRGNTLIDTISASTGTFSKTISNVSAGTYNYHAVFEDSRFNSISTSNITVTVNPKSTSLTMTLPNTLVYGDSFNITGVLTDGTNPIGNASVNLLVGATVVDTAITNNNGQVTFNRTPVNMGTHTFQLTYNGATNYNTSSSSAVSKEIGKETSVLTVTSPVTSSISMYEGSLNITGTLKTDDNENITGTILIMEDNNTLTTIAVDNGVFNGNVNLTEGTHNIEIVYNATSYYTSSSVSKTVEVIAPSLTLESDSDILSYADGEFAVLTATLEDLDIVGKLVTFEVRKVSDDSLVESLTGTTDNTGVATVDYYGKGAGDLYIKAICSNITSNTVDIEDCIKSYNQTFSSANILDLNLPSSFKIEFKLNSNSYRDPNIAYLRFNNNSNGYVGKSSSSRRNIVLYDEEHVLNQIPVSTDTVYVITYDNQEITLTNDNDSVSISNKLISSLYSVTGSNNCVLKDLKIKKL